MGFVADKQQQPVVILYNNANNCTQCIVGLPKKLENTARYLRKMGLKATIYTNPMLKGERAMFLSSYGFDKRNTTLVDHTDSLRKYVYYFLPKTRMFEVARSIVVYKDRQQRDSIYYLDLKGFFPEE